MESQKLQLHVHRQVPIIIEFRSSTVHFFGVNAIRVATWTAENGQDDLVWRDINYNSSTMSGYIDLPAKDKKGGPYINDVYIWDYAGQFSMYVLLRIHLLKCQNC